ncbi:MAG: DeoR family transcriptional regulator, partial [Deltaproteobacteria bacterium]|nr:DeoR family transcriptional regulator [Deltaproteobacteria bacterium]
MKKTTPFLPAERQQRILEILREELSVRGSRLGELLGVSEMTIRRDL